MPHHFALTEPLIALGSQVQKSKRFFRPIIIAACGNKFKFHIYHCNFLRWRRRRCLWASSSCRRRSGRSRLGRRSGCWWRIYFQSKSQSRLDKRRNRVLLPFTRLCQFTEILNSAGQTQVLFDTYIPLEAEDNKRNHDRQSRNCD